MRCKIWERSWTALNTGVGIWGLLVLDEPLCTYYIGDVMAGKRTDDTMDFAVTFLAMDTLFLYY